MRRRLLRGVGAAAVVAGLFGGGAVAASAKTIFMPTLQKEVQMQHAYWQQHVFAPVGSLQPPAPPCPENGELPSPFSNCGLPEFPATTLPCSANMSYYGGQVQTDPEGVPRLWGWGEPGAFPAADTCAVGEQSPRDRSPRRWHVTPTAPASTWPTGSSSSAARSGPASRPSTTRPIRPEPRCTSRTRPTSSGRDLGGRHERREHARGDILEQPAGRDEHLHGPGRRGSASGGALRHHRPGQQQHRHRPAA